MTRLRGNFIDSIAQAIGNSYIALLCINRAYPHSYWCKRGKNETNSNEILFFLKRHNFWPKNKSNVFRVTWKTHFHLMIG